VIAYIPTKNVGTYAPPANQRVNITRGRISVLARFLLALLPAFMWLGIVPGSQAGVCILDGVKDGEYVKIRGVVFPTDHDVFVRPTGCPDKRVIIVYGDDPSLGKRGLPMKRNETFNEFEKLLYEEQPTKPRVVCRLCFKYWITATFEGRLDTTESAGWKKDPQTGRITGLEGFGHPLPFTRYQLVVKRVSKVETVERNK
jgi:hypothetical protein